MNTIDIVILIILLIGGLNGLRQGFIQAFASLAGWIFAFIVAAKYAVVVAPYMAGLSHDPVVQKIAAFAAIVLGILVLTWLVSALLGSILNSLRLGLLNRLVGGVFGTLKGLFIVLIIMHMLGPWVESSPHWKQSKAIQLLLPYASRVTELGKDAASLALNEIQSSGSQSAGTGSEPDTAEKVKSFDSVRNSFY
ncbi:CvpA family protein [Acinetobacter sp. WZC-1]|uniref:CvpA family protein n=1 Tax=Acinetobacter sp. WZC-1 TaxID=3459034 RepID=UPI00403D5683